MKKIRLFNDYGAYPIWIYDENNNLIGNDLPDNLLKDKEAVKLRNLISKKYDNLFIDNDEEFKYIGFQSKTDEEEFIYLANSFYNLLVCKVGNEFFIENNLLDVL